MKKAIWGKVIFSRVITPAETACMDLSIIIINWNSVGFLRTCLESVYRNTMDVEFEVIVLDNGSFDKCGEMLAQEFPQVRFLQGDKNLGFARGNNLAASHSRGSTFLFLNPDTEIRGPALKILYDSLCSLPDAGAIGARLINSDGTLQTTCLQTFPTIANKILDSNFVQRLFPKAKFLGTDPLFAQSDRPMPVEGISGACLMTSKEVFRKVSGFSEDYFMYFEDMDFCLKVIRSGYKNYFIPNAVIVHHGGKSAGGEYSRFSNVMMAESGWKFFCKQQGYYYALMYRVILAVKAVFISCILGAALMFSFEKKKRAQITGALGKWIHILGWCLGTEQWVKTLRAK